MPDPRRLVKLGWTAPDETECVVRLRYYPGRPATGILGHTVCEPAEDPSIEVEAVVEDPGGRNRPDLIEVAQADLDLAGKAGEHIRDSDAAEDESEWERRKETM
jgi:hypothetical protein